MASSSSVFPAIDATKATSTIPMRVRFCETDLMGIVHHASYLVYFEAGRVEWLRRRGVTYADWAARGVHLPVVDLQVTYQAPARFDDVLSVETALIELRSVSLKFGYRILRGETKICEGYTRLGCITYSGTLAGPPAGNPKLFKIPEEMRAVLLAGEESGTA